jgi:DNA-binding beta-propeller fold protein YncE
VNIEDSSVVLCLDAANLKTTASWPLAPGEGPSGLAIDVARHRLFSVCDNNKMVILDTQSGKVIASPSVGEGADAVAFDAAHQLAFSSNGESGTLSVIAASAPADYHAVQTVATKLGARTMALDPASGMLYTVSATLGPKPAASPSNPKRRPAILPDSFVVLVYSR